jgi:carboxypeptidase C (cathepsin A)
MEKAILKNAILKYGLLAMAAVVPAAAQGPVMPHADAASVTKGQVTTSAGKTIHYTATAAQYPIYVNDTGELMATMFFVAYVADRAPGESPRPLTFIWNGGPGSSASQVHVVGFGPKHVKSPDTYPEWTANLETPIVDNPDTWLAASDLVFVDPPGTGYSRATTKEYRDILYTTRGDAEAVAELIRVYMHRNRRWGSPLFIAGESYGTTRAMAVANALEYRRNHLDGVILISGGFDVGQTVPETVNTSLGLSKWAATGHYHKLLAADLQSLPRDEAVKRAVEWARQVYAPALQRRDSLTATERNEILDGLHRYTGIDPKYVNRQTLIVDNWYDNLLRNKGLELGHYDTRMSVKYRGEGVNWLPWNDPSLLPMVDLMEGTSLVFENYLRDTLKFDSDLLYRGPWGKAFHPEPLDVNSAGVGSDWMARMFVTGDYNITPAEAQIRREAGVRGRGGAPSEQPTRVPALRRAMDLNPKLQVENIVGMYDGSCAAKDEEVARMDPQLKGRVVNRCYVGGHMWYSDRPTRIQATRDFAEFVRGAIAAQTAH